ncbi:MAG TPA: lamin tail domain-containing protein, partial [Verrucomicrobiae bacterium]
MTKVLLAILACLSLTLAPLPAATVRISEFLAENDGGLIDGDGDTTDWIEIQNTTASLVNLGGWRLTDDSTNLTKWTFPPTNLAANGFLIVFASGKNRATNGAELHASFQLNSDGGYLALVDSSGIIASEFNYPPQHRNVSFGPTSSNPPPLNLLLPGAMARTFVPVNNSLGTSWTAPAFNDSTWSNAATPLRFDPGPAATGAPVLSVDFNGNTAGFVDTNPPANTEVGFDTMTLTNNPRTFNGITVQVSAFNGGVLSYFDRSTPTQSVLLTLDQVYDDAIYVQGQTNGNGARIQITGLTPSQNYQLTLWSFDSGSLGARVSDWTETASGLTRVITNGYSFDGNVLPTRDGDATLGGPVIASASGALTIEGRRNGGTSHGVFMNGLRLSPLYSLTATGNLASMYNANASVYARMPFTVGSTNGLSSVTLRVKYNDGFVAYLNGAEVARRNAPAAVDWNSAATSAHSGAASEDIVLPGTAGLIAGNNVLALQGLNLQATNSDFFLEPQLMANLVSAVNNGFFSPPTPGAVNGVSYFGVVADTKFSADRGFFDAPFSLSITCATPGATIYFTTNGSAPSPAGGVLFSSPISITGNSFIRAQAFLSGYLPSGVDTHSYIFLRDVLRQSNNIPGYPTVWQASYPADYGMDSNIVAHPVYGATISNDLRSIPSLMIVSDHEGLWNASTGIYPDAQNRTGPAYDRAASLELIDGSGHSEFTITAKIAMHGNASRDNVRTPKHSMHASFNSDYGPTKLRYDWFGGGVDVHDGIVFRSCGFVDGWAGRYADNATYVSSETGETFRGLRYRPENTCYLRDVWFKDTFREMGWIASRSAFVHLYINGLYWGLYEPSERINSSYFNQHLGGPEGAWDVLVGNDAGAPPDVVDGSVADWNNVLALAGAGIANESAYQAIAALIDVDNLIDYMMVHIFAESEDWPHHNWYVAHRRATNGIPGTKFTCTIWDQELSLDRLVRRNRVGAGNLTNGEQYSPARIYSQLRNWPEFRRQFGDRVQKHLFNGGALTPSNNVARLRASASVISNAVVGESARWGDARKIGVPAGQLGTGVTFTRDEWWQPEIDKLATNFFQKLTADNIARFQANSLYPQLGAPLFSQFGGAVNAGFALIMGHTNASGLIYFTTDGSDPRTYGSGAVAGSAQAYSAPIPINTPTFVRARVLNGASWSALVEAVFFPPQDLSKLALTELMYHPPDVGITNSDEFEFLELKNAGTNTLNLSGLVFSGINFTFPNGAMLAPGQFFVLVRNPTFFASKHPGVTINGIYTGRLDNGGEPITLSHPLGATIFSVTYADVAPWPIPADGFGFSLVPINPGVSQAPDDGTKWRASRFIGGSPGADDPTPGTAPIVINEILTHTTLPFVDTIELFNPTGTNVNIGGWFLSDDSIPKKYRIANGTTILAGDFLTFNELQFNPTPGTNNSFSLGASGEQIYLLAGDANTNLTGYAHGVAFDGAANNVSFGRYINSVGEEQFPPQPRTFNSANAGPLVQSVVINEIHYNPAAGGDEFIELKNTDAVNPRPLFDAGVSSNTWSLAGVDFTFSTNTVIAPNSFLLIVATNPVNFRAKYSVPANIPIVGPYLGTLQNSGERIEL